MRQSQRRATLVLALAFVSACASGQASTSAVGTSAAANASAQAAIGVMAFTYHPNGFIERARETDLALRRCAQVAYGDGYPFFIIVQSSREARRPGAAELSAAERGVTVADNAAPGTRTAYLGRRYVSVKPSNTNVIVGFTTPPDGFSYASLNVIRDIKGKYGITD